jgi:DNA-binding IclR family transcriptional regulator
MTTEKHDTPTSTWTFLTNHSHVLLCIAEEPEARMRDVAERVGITERAVQRIIDDLAEAGYLLVQREGRRNHYQVVERLRLRHPVEAHCEVSGLINLVLEKRLVKGRR